VAAVQHVGVVTVRDYKQVLFLLRPPVCCLWGVCTPLVGMYSC
jgi:hypothetical protein